MVAPPLGIVAYVHAYRGSASGCSPVVSPVDGEYEGKYAEACNISHEPHVQNTPRH